MQHLCCKNSHYSISEHKHLHSFHWIFLMALILLVSYFLYFMINQAILLDTVFPIGLGSSYFWSILFSISFFVSNPQTILKGTRNSLLFFLDSRGLFYNCIFSNLLYSIFSFGTGLAPRGCDSIRFSAAYGSIFYFFIYFILIWLFNSSLKIYMSNSRQMFVRGIDSPTTLPIQ